jgi:hypothetical protein
MSAHRLYSRKGEVWQAEETPAVIIAITGGDYRRFNIQKNVKPAINFIAMSLYSQGCLENLFRNTIIPNTWR